MNNDDDDDDNFGINNKSESNSNITVFTTVTTVLSLRTMFLTPCQLPRMCHCYLHPKREQLKYSTVVSTRALMSKTDDDE